MADAPIDFDKIFSPRHHYGIILIFLVLIIGIVLLYQPTRQSGQSTEGTATTMPLDSLRTEKLGPSVVQNTTPLDVADACSKFTETDTVSCEDASGVALKEVENYGNDVYSIASKSIQLPLYNTSKNNTSKNLDVWIFQIKFKDTVTDKEIFPGITKVGYVEIAVDRNTKEDFIIAYGPSLS